VGEIGPRAAGNLQCVLDVVGLRDGVASVVGGHLRSVTPPIVV